ncbi:Octanoyltransferase [Aquisphaera giovannonii]|uniref:Octanoyltransferase n=1 Tax=Aquisphaera giovannonii TaxID=406548 RepID=A0A5B9WB80_9BACT|nr:lipoyl(octanoyl) transferase LipB [Aquisphaera giovannonii]QEH37295.1 Octanoyltransferase [Aquisphaera giovannonii]
MQPSSALPMQVHLLGLADFIEVQALQRRMVYELGERGGASLLLCEHPPTISVGRSGSRAHIVPDDETLRALGVRVHWVNRGGDCVLHLPGQLVAYLAYPLNLGGLSLVGYVNRLEEVILAALREFDLEGCVRPGYPGVFLGRARVATVGVAVNRWIAYHGFTINVGPTLAPFGILDEPGPGSLPLRQTSMESRRQRPTPMPKVREAVIRHLGRILELDEYHVHAGHPLIRRKVPSHAYAPSPG